MGLVVGECTGFLGLGSPHRIWEKSPLRRTELRIPEPRVIPGSKAPKATRWWRPGACPGAWKPGPECPALLRPGLVATGPGNVGLMGGGEGPNVRLQPDSAPGLAGGAAGQLIVLLTQPKVRVLDRQTPLCPPALCISWTPWAHVGEPGPRAVSSACLWLCAAVLPLQVLLP